MRSDQPRGVVLWYSGTARLSGRQWLEQPRRFGDTNEVSEARRFGGDDTPSECGEPVIAAALIVEVGSWSPRGFFEQPVSSQTTDRTVQRARLELDAPGSVLEHVLHDPVPVSFLRREHEQDQEIDRAEGKKLLGRAHGSRRQGYRRCAYSLTDEAAEGLRGHGPIRSAEPPNPALFAPV